MKISKLSLLLTALMTIGQALWAEPPALTPKTSEPQLNIVPKAPKLANKAYVLLDPHSNQILAQHNMDLKIEPASLTKLMSLYIVAHALQNNQIHLNDQVLISKNAWHAEGSRMFVKPGSKVAVEDLIYGVTVASGNDATVALAEHIAGTEENFVGLMNQVAQSLGMTNSHFVNATGLPNRNHYTTAHDLATLAEKWQHSFPQYYHWFSKKWIKYNKIKQPNRNRLLWRDAFVDGMKTGHTKSAGYCLIASGKQKDMRLISVIVGTQSDLARTEQSEQLLNYGFHFYTTKKIIGANQKLAELTTYMGEHSSTPLGSESNIYVTVPKFSSFNYQTKLLISKPLIAPVRKNQSVGQMKILSQHHTIKTIELSTLAANNEGSLLSTLFDRMRLWLHPLPTNS